MNRNEEKFFSIEDLSEKNSKCSFDQTMETLDKMFSDIKDFARGSSVNIFRGISIYSSIDGDNVVAPTVLLNGKDAFVAMGYVSERPEQIANYEAVLCQSSIDYYDISANFPNISLAEAFQTMNEICKKMEKSCFLQTVLVETKLSVMVYIKTEEGSEKYAEIKDFLVKKSGILE